MSQYLGDISAYALAVSQGYTGTEEEYAELMASYATVGQTAVTAAQTATTKASEAATNATTATNKASEATTAATTATTKAGEASTSASTATSAKDTAVSASQTATSKATEATTAAATANAAKDTATSKATEATTAASTATTKANEASASAQSIAQSAAQIQENTDDIDQLMSDLYHTISTIGKAPTGAYRTTGGNMTPNNRIKTDRIACKQGDWVYFDFGKTSAGFAINGGFTVYSAETGNAYVYDSPWRTKNGFYEIPNNGYLGFYFGPQVETDAFSADTDCDGCAYYIANIPALLTEVGETLTKINTLELATNNIRVPLLRNGSAGNSGNANAICTQYVLPIDHTFDKITVEFMGNDSLADSYAFAYVMFSGANDGMTTTAAILDMSIGRKYANDNADQLVNVPHITIDLADMRGYDHVSFFMWRQKNGAWIPLRIADDQYSIKITYEYDVESDDPVLRNVNNARHIPNNNGTALTLLHFSDVHADTSALNRILEDGEKYGSLIDEIICTGDIVGNTAAQITSWWDENVLTCIGNHDSASYSAETGYNWTALSMADRDAYYIAPFESNWSIVHTSGTSYYYKDYTTQKVRLIVMDAMLYNDNGAEATAQTTWLEGLLSDAITNNLHVLIAIHAPHGGATAEDCSFSKYNQGVMPTYSDCNTPQTVIDTVATAITGGLHFVGYLVGHTHQDNVWDAEGDGTQLMFCITCAAVSDVNQWKNSDQYRDAQNDAYNLVTIDTANTLVKIVRGGGDDIDDHMRTRKAICFNYSTGEKVGEVL